MRRLDHGRHGLVFSPGQLHRKIAEASGLPSRPRRAPGWLARRSDMKSFARRYCSTIPPSMINVWPVM
jgi:hypothetical protein